MVVCLFYKTLLQKKIIMVLQNTRYINRWDSCFRPDIYIMLDNSVEPELSKKYHVEPGFKQ